MVDGWERGHTPRCRFRSLYWLRAGQQAHRVSGGNGRLSRRAQAVSVVMFPMWWCREVWRMW